MLKDYINILAYPYILSRVKYYKIKPALNKAGYLDIYLLKEDVVDYSYEWIVVWAINYRATQCCGDCDNN